ncbi:MAG: hypothetical protein IJ551_09585 [Prevotella sp.]|nr:hypothetical protein [Prevotella sp.]
MKTLVLLNIILDIILLVLCVVGTIMGKTVQPWVLGMFVFYLLMTNLQKYSEL